MLMDNDNELRYYEKDPSQSGAQAKPHKTITLSTVSKVEEW